MGGVIREREGERERDGGALGNVSMDGMRLWDAPWVFCGLSPGVLQVFSGCSMDVFSGCNLDILWVCSTGGIWVFFRCVLWVCSQTRSVLVLWVCSLGVLCLCSKGCSLMFSDKGFLHLNEYVLIITVLQASQKCSFVLAGVLSVA